MLTRAPCDVVTLPRDHSSVKQSDQYLSTLSPKDKPWDRHRGEADDVKEVFAASPISRHRAYAERVTYCSQILEFARDPPKGGIPSKLKLKNVRFCHVRQCPICQWRRSLRWQAKVYQALPRLVRDYPTVRFIFLTLTIRNCKVSELRKTLDDMGKAWDRLTKLRNWPGMGWVRSTEITRSKNGTAHPHYHVLLMVRPMYFQGEYISQRDWSLLWKQSLRIDYVPVVHIRIVEPDHKPDRRKTPGPTDIWGAVVEILKYSVKVSDMIRDDRWFLILVDQVRRTKAIIVGGVLKKYIRERGREDLTEEPGKEPSTEEAERLFFGWKQAVRRYRRIGPTQ